MTCLDQQDNNSWEQRWQKQDAVNKRSQHPAAKRQGTKYLNETQPTPSSKDPQLTTKEGGGNSAIAIMVGEASKQNGDLSTLTGRSKGSSSTLSS